MSIYMLATLKVRSGRYTEFCALMGELKQATEAEGWRLIGGWVNFIGRLNTVVDIWEIPDGNHVQSGFAAIYAHAKWPEWEQRIAETVEEEVTQLMMAVPYA